MYRFTLSRLLQEYPCENGLNLLLQHRRSNMDGKIHLSGHTSFTVAEVLAGNGLLDAIWCLQMWNTPELIANLRKFSHSLMLKLKPIIDAGLYRDRVNGKIRTVRWYEFQKILKAAERKSPPFSSFSLGLISGRVNNVLHYYSQVWRGADSEDVTFYLRTQIEFFMLLDLNVILEKKAKEKRPLEPYQPVQPGDDWVAAAEAYSDSAEPGWFPYNYKKILMNALYDMCEAPIRKKIRFDADLKDNLVRRIMTQFEWLSAEFEKTVLTKKGKACKAD